jgi:cytochrome c2
MPWRLVRGSASLGAALVLGLLIALAAAGLYWGYTTIKNREQRATAIALTGGDPEMGRALILRYGCRGCHTIPGVPGAAQVGPDLHDVARRIYIGGVLTNTPENMIRWIENPRAVDPKTAMPVTGISRPEARDVTAYLFSLR